QPDAASSAGDAALVHHRVENDQEVEIESSPIHWKHVCGMSINFKHASRPPWAQDAGGAGWRGRFQAGSPMPEEAQRVAPIASPRPGPHGKKPNSRSLTVWI